jgi:hypothetical protein
MIFLVFHFTIIFIFLSSRIAHNVTAVYDIFAVAGATAKMWREKNAKIP